MLPTRTAQSPREFYKEGRPEQHLGRQSLYLSGPADGACAAPFDRQQCREFHANGLFFGGRPPRTRHWAQRRGRGGKDGGGHGRSNRAHAFGHRLYRSPRRGNKRKGCGGEVRLFVWAEGDPRAQIQSTRVPTNCQKPPRIRGYHCSRVVARGESRSPFSVGKELV